MNSSTFSTDITTARTVVEGLNLKGFRPTAVKAFLDATTDEERDIALETFSGGTVRRGLRQLARRFDRKGDAATADVFWALRDDVDEDDDTCFRVDSDVVFVAAA